MNNTDRIKARIERDKQRRAAKKQLKYAENDNYDNVINYKNYYAALQKCRKGVNWKGSVQRYCQTAPAHICKTIETLRAGELPKFTSTRTIMIYERGKKRKIVPVTISDRMTQRVLCDNALTPVICGSLIYDNGASLPNKGVEFARQRTLRHLHEAQREFGNDFYVLVFDFKSYFDSIPHKQCLYYMRKYFHDEGIIELVMNIILSYSIPAIEKIGNEDARKLKLEQLHNFELQGICLGSQISQLMALVIPNDLDHYIKDRCGIRHYVRYMDDGFILAKTKEELSDLFKKLRVIAEQLGLKFNENKSTIVKITKGFSFLKVRYYINKSGHLVRNLVRSGIVRQRRKLKKFKPMVSSGRMTLEDVYNSMQSWLAHSSIAKSYHTKTRMQKLCKELYGDIMTVQNRRRGSDAVLQADKKWHVYWSRNLA